MRRPTRGHHPYTVADDCCIHLACAYVTYLHQRTGLSDRRQLYRHYIAYLGAIRRR